MPQSQQTYSCKACSTTYIKQSELEEHSKWHKLQLERMQSAYVKLECVNIFRCVICTRGFLDGKDLKNHQKKYYKKEINQGSEDNNNQYEKPYKCQECGRRFVKESTLLTHSIIHKPFPHACECGIGYYKKCDLDSHRRLVHPLFKPHNPIPKLRQEFTVNSKTQYKSDSEAEVSEDPEESPDNNYTPNSKLGPRLKANLTYKQSKNKSIKTSKNNQKQTNKRNKENMVIKDESGLYKCPVCAKTYVSRTGINGHLTEHTGKKHKCDQCLKEFATPNNLKLHKRSHSCIKDHSCSVCGKKLSTKKNLKMHMRVHTGEKPYACNLCPKKFTQSGTLKLHIFRHKGVRNHKCEQCKRRFFLLDELVRHRRVHTGEKPYVCKSCGKCFADPSACRRHEFIHTGLKPHKCDVCPKAYCDPAALFRHKRLHSGFNVPCTHCDRTFKSRGQMLNHVKTTHRPVKEDEKFECDHCGKKFMFKPYLVIHMKGIHLKRIPKSECDICGKMLSSAMLKRHVLQVHLQAFKFECEQCGKVLHSKNNLLNHMSRVHGSKIKENIYECDYCHACFPYKNAVGKHITFKHLGIQCKVCKKNFPTTLKLRNHKANGCVKCPVCHIAFNTKTRMEHHFVRHLPRSQRQIFECHYCRKQFPFKANLSKHIETIHEMKSYSCDHCNMSFSSRSLICNHIWDKHMVSLYCNVCLKRFYNEREFNQHKRVGCQQKKLQCGICERIFTTTSTLQSHLMSHAPKRLECDLCGVKYQRKRCMIRHLGSAHGFKDEKNKIVK